MCVALYLGLRDELKYMVRPARLAAAKTAA